MRETRVFRRNQVGEYGESPPPANGREGRGLRRALLWLAVGAIGLGLYFVVPRQFRLHSPWDDELPLVSVSFAATDANGDVVVIDSSRRRVLRLSADGTLLTMISGGSRDPGSLFYAHEAALGPDGSIFVLNWVLDKQAYFLEREEIQEYDASGRFVRTIHSVDLRSSRQEGYRVGLRPLTRSLALHDRHLRWLELEAGGIVNRIADLATGESWMVSKFNVPGANIAVAEAKVSPAGRLVMSHKDGTLHSCRPRRDLELLYSADASGRLTPDGVPSVPWGVAVDGAGSVYFTDPVFREIRRLEGGGGASVPVWSTQALYEASSRYRAGLEAEGLNPADASFARISATFEGDLVVYSANTVAVLPKGEPENAVLHHGSTLSLKLRLYAFLSWCGMLLAGVSIFFIIRTTYFDVFMQKLPGGMLRAAGLMLVVALTLVVTIPMLVSKMMEHNLKLEEQRIAQMLSTVPRLLDGDRIAGLRRAGDFMNSDYRAVRGALREILLDGEVLWNNGNYCAVYRFFDNRIYAAMYLNDEVGLFYPLAWNDVDLYRDAYERGVVATSTSRDADGSWIFGVAPLRNSDGAIVAVFETGSDMVVVEERIASLARTAVMDALTLLAVLVLLMFEILFFLNLLKNLSGRTKTPEKPRVSPFLVSRPIVCLFFTAMSFPSVFIALYMRELYQPTWLPEDVMLAVPLSAQMFAGGVAVLFAAGLIRRFGATTVIHQGFLVSAAGLWAAYQFASMGGFIAGNIVIGFGSGLGFIGIRSLLFNETDTDQQNAGYSHFYSGMIAGCYVGLGIGSALAYYIGYRLTLLAAAVTMLAAWLAVWRLMLPVLPAFSRSPSAAASASGLTWRDVAAVIRSWRVTGFFVLHLLPVYVFSCFGMYYFPLFAEGQGLDVNNIGHILLLHGLTIIYLGPPACERLLPLLGSRRIVFFGQLGWCAGLIAFALTGSLLAGIVVLLGLSVVESVCVSGENAYIMGLEETKRLGEERVAAMNEMVGKVGETVGPIVFALAIGFGRMGMLYMGIAGAAMAVVFAAVLRRSGKRAP